jgi:hypothetical protein
MVNTSFLGQDMAATHSIPNAMLLIRFGLADTWPGRIQRLSLSESQVAHGRPRKGHTEKVVLVERNRMRSNERSILDARSRFLGGW